MRTRSRAGRVMLLTAAAALCLAGAPVSAAEPQLAMAVVQDGEVEYLSGGVSEREREELRERAYDFRVFVSFVVPAGERPVRSVDVTLTPEEHPRRAVDLKTAGPVLLISMPTGRYRIEAKLPGGRPVVHQLVLRPGAIEQVDIELEAPRPGAWVDCVGA